MISSLIFQGCQECTHNYNWICPLCLVFSFFLVHFQLHIVFFRARSSYNCSKQNNFNFSLVIYSSSKNSGWICSLIQQFFSWLLMVFSRILTQKHRYSSLKAKLAFIETQRDIVIKCIFLHLNNTSSIVAEINPSTFCYRGPFVLRSKWLFDNIILFLLIIVRTILSKNTEC